MGLSYDLISEFVKITNDKKENTKEGTVYATVVSGTDGKYVQIDGSDLLTPTDTTTDIEDGERVTLMIKDHKAIVTGNVTTPSASTSKVDKVTESINSVSDRVGTFELVVADKISTKELEAYKATIDVLVAKKATIEDLTATNAKIENLEVKNAEIENLVAEKATIEDLEAVNATIENLKVKDAEIENAVIENLKATTADIKILNADFAQIKTLVNGNLTSDNILSFNLTSEKVTVDDAFIKDAMIDTISAGKINAGKINTNSVSIGSEDGGMLITGSTQQFTDKNGNVRIQIGKDASGDFTFILYGEDGKGQLINQNGIMASAISDGLIVNDMVSDHAAISGGKLDISSVITEINSDNSTTIKSSKIYLNDQDQSLEVAFNSLKTKVDTIQEVTIQGDLTAIVEQVQSNTSKIEANKDSISTLISEDTAIKKQVTDLQGTLSETETTLTSKYTSLKQNLDGFKMTVADTYATKKNVTDVVDNISTNYSTTSVMNSAIEQKAQEISASVSSTYATKNQVNTLDNNLKSNYSTTQQMESAINIAKEEINLGVSSIYETKENVESKVNSINVGGRNYVRDYMFKKTNIWKCNISYASIDTRNGYGCLSETTSNPHLYQEMPIDIFSKGQTVTIQYEIKCEGVSANTGSDSFMIRSLITKCKNNRLDGDVCILGKHEGNSDSLTSWTKVIVTGVIGDLKDSDSLRLRLYARNFKGKIYFRNVKLELGNKATDLSPAPEDIDTNIDNAKSEAITSANNTLTSTISNYYTKSQTDSQIDIAKEEINLGVSSKYETKENIETKVTSTLDFAKSYANTKKSEAISTAASDATLKANTAKQEAITSANNTLTSTISNYYTKSQTDSRIDIAKEEINLGVSSTYETKKNVESKVSSTLNSAKSYADSQINVAKNAITQSVSSTYETKTNVTNKINGVNSSISSLQTRMNTAESKITDTAITNTVKKNFYTKTETENAITSKGYATQSQVQQTADNIQFKFTQTGGYNLVRNGNPKPHNYRHWWVSDNANWFLESADIGVQTIDTNEVYASCATFKVESGKTYSLSCWLMAEINTKGADVYFIGSANDDGAYTEVHHLYHGSGNSTWVNVKATFTIGSNINYGFVRIDNNGRKDTSIGYYTVVFFSEVQMVKGSECYPQWSPNPNEVYEGIVRIDRDGVNVSASNINGYAKMTANGFFVNKGGKDLVSVDSYGLRLFDAKIQLTHVNGNKYFSLDENGIIMYNPANGTHQWGKISAINNKFTIASNGNSSGLSLGHHVDDNYVEDILCDSYGYLTVHRQMNHNGIYNNNYGQIFIRQSGQSGWEITGRSDSQSIKPGGANQGSLGSNTQYVNQSWIANRYNPSSIEVKHVSHYVEDNECISLVNGVKPARYFYKEYDEEGNDITTFASRSSQLGLIYEDVRECSARDLITNEEDKGINLYGMVSTLWGATRNVNTRLNDAEYEIVLLKEEIEQLKNKLGEK